MKNKKNKHESSQSPEYPGIHNVVSSGDVTGLEPAMPVSEAEDEGYSSLYEIPKPKKSREHKKMKDPGGKV